jgi:ATP-dependent Clp protease ATP-binding subunit ClpA
VSRGAIERTFSPEFRNRLDAWIAFDPLAPDAVARVVDRQVGELASQLREKQVVLELMPVGRAWLAERGFSPQFGARPMARLIQNEIKKPLAEAILFGALKAAGGRVRIEAHDGKLELVVEAAASA